MQWPKEERSGNRGDQSSTLGTLRCLWDKKAVGYETGAQRRGWGWTKGVTKYMIQVFKPMGTDKFALRKLQRKKRNQDNTLWKEEAAANDTKGKTRRAWCCGSWGGRKNLGERNKLYQLLSTVKYPPGFGSKESTGDFDKNNLKKWGKVEVKLYWKSEDEREIETFWADDMRKKWI